MNSIIENSFRFDMKRTDGHLDVTSQHMRLFDFIWPKCWCHFSFSKLKFFAVESNQINLCLKSWNVAGQMVSLFPLLFHYKFVDFNGWQKADGKCERVKIDAIGLEFLHVHFIRHRRPRRRWSLVNYCYSSSQGNTTARCSDVGCILFSKNKMIRFGRKEKLFCFIFGLSVLQNRFLNANFCYYLQSNRQ